MGLEVIVETCMGIKSEENVLLIVQENQEGEKIAGALMSKISELEAEPTLEKVKGSEMKVEPPKHVVDLMLSSDVILSILEPQYTQLFAHMDARAKATEAGARAGLIPLLSNRMSNLFGGASSTMDFLESLEEDNVLKIKNVTEKIAEMIDKGEKAHITTAKGTDVTMDINDRPIQQLKGVNTKPGDWGPIPFYAEAAVAPVEGSPQGNAFIDVFIEKIGKIEEPIKWEIKNGKLVDIEDGSGAEELEKIIENADENGTNIAELGVGTNPFIKDFTGTLADKLVLGTVHLAIGKNINIGGKVKSNIHHDAVIKDATIEIGEKTILQNGKYKI